MPTWETRRRYDASRAKLMSAILEVSGLDAAYGQSQVLFGLDLTIETGEVATLLGRNGMGKTTTIRAILGLTPPRAGSVRFRGKLLDRATPDRIARAGIAVVPEGRQIFPNLSVQENLVAFAGNRSGVQEPWTLARVYELFPRLLDRRRNLGNQLSGGEQQMLAIGRALMTNPHLLILDEATEGLAPLIRAEIWRCLASLKQSGLSILVIDKNVGALMRVADRHFLIERGRVVWKGSSSELASAPDLQHRYLGV